MGLLYTFVIALANNLDNIGVRIAYSIRGIKIPVPKNLWISVITFIISAGASYFGEFTAKYLSRDITSIISMILLVGIGLWIIIEPYIKNKKEEVVAEKKDFTIKGILRNPENADVDNSIDIDFREATLLGIALSVNNIGGGISAGMIGLPWYFVGVFSAIISFVALWLGNYVTDFFKKWNLESKATIISGLALILLGIYQLFN